MKLVLVHMGEFKLSSSLCGSNPLSDDLAHTLDVLKHLAGIWWYLPATGAMPVRLATRAVDWKHPPPRHDKLQLTNRHSLDMREE